MRRASQHRLDQRDERAEVGWLFEAGGRLEFGIGGHFSKQYASHGDGVTAGRHAPYGPSRPTRATASSTAAQVLMPL